MLDTAATFGSAEGSSAWIGGVLAQNGVIYGIPFNSTAVLRIGGICDDVQLDFCVSRFFNKF